MSHWRFHPAVRTGPDLTFGERSADRLKAAFGSWRFLLSMIGGIVFWICWNKLAPHGWHFDSTDLLFLNLTLSIMAGLQGGALQIASNRGDRISSELARHTYENGLVDKQNGERLMQMNKQQLQILQELRDIRRRLDEEA
jgi:uncharacterized membrane protein